MSVPPTTVEPLVPAILDGSRIYAVPCWFCGVDAGRQCISANTGLPVKDPHARRWEALSAAHRSRQMWFVLLHDDPRFRLCAGDIVRCVDYPYDAKVSVLFREEDGFEPECNQYLHDVAFIGFVPTDMEAS